MRRNTTKQLLIFLTFLFGTFSLAAQDGSAKASETKEFKKEIRFNGLGRASILQTELDGDLRSTDTTSVQSLNDGEFLLDLAINATPSENTEVQSILRLRNEYGGFFGAGVTVEVRELWARGIIADVVEYRVGDMDMAMTPYTLFMPDEEGTINEPAVFAPQKEVIAYEQFYTENNERRLQGAKLNFGLEFTKGIDEMDVTGFISRIRGTDFFTTPTRFVGGGHINLLRESQDSMGFDAAVGLNYINTWDDLRSGEANTGIRNAVYTVDFDFTVYENENLALHVLGETGQSNLKVAEYDQDGDPEYSTLEEEDDTFLEAGVSVELKSSNLKFSASYIDVGPDFFSMGAQTKRIDFQREKTYYNRTGNDGAFRMPTLFDIARDRALYTFQLSDQLMSYDPRYSNAQPYGSATPNRSGIKLGLNYQPDDEKYNVAIEGALLEEIRGQGTAELKQFTLVRARANVNLHKFIEWKKNLKLTLGYQFENTERSGGEIEQVDLSSNLLEVGLEAELFKNFDLLLGVKSLAASGSDYVPLIENFNDVKDFPGRFIVEDNETLLGAGLKYRFSEDIYITVQYQQFSFSRETDPANDYDLNQVFVLYNMNF